MLIILICGLLVQPGWSQEVNVHELNREINRNFRKDPVKTVALLKDLLAHEQILHDTLAAIAYNKLGISLIQMADYQSSFPYFQEGIKRSARYPAIQAKVLTNKAIASRSSADYESSLSTLSQALEIYQQLDDKKGMAVVFAEMASNYNYMLKPSKAVEYLKKGITILEQEKDTETLPILKQKLANSYFNNGDYSFASELYQEVLPTFKNSGSSNYYYTLLNYGDCLFYLGEFEKAATSYKIAQEGLESINNEEFAYFALSKRGRTFAKLDETKKALSAYNQAIEGLFRKRSSRVTQAVCEYLELLNNKGDYRKALAVVEKYNDFLEKDEVDFMNYREELEFLDESYRTFKHLGMLRKALFISERLRGLKDSIVQVRNEQQIAEIHEKYQNQIQKEKNEALLKNIDLLNGDLDKKNKIIFLSVLVVILILSSTYFFFNKMRYKEKLKQVMIENLNNQKRIIENKHREEERKRVEKERLMQSKQREMIASTMEIADIQKKIKGILQEESPKDPAVLKKRILKVIEEKNYWKEFQARFTEVHPSFFEKWLERYPSLTKNDLQFCSLLKIGLTNKEIAALLGISHQSAITKKYRIKKKIGISEDAEFEKLLQAL